MYAIFGTLVLSVKMTSSASLHTRIDSLGLQARSRMELAFYIV
jgi:hypothetical protein